MEHFNVLKLDVEKALKNQTLKNQLTVPAGFILFCQHWGLRGTETCSNNRYCSILINQRHIDTRILPNQKLYFEMNIVMLDTTLLLKGFLANGKVATNL